MSLPPRIVIVGAAGRLGQALHGRFSQQARVTGLTRADLDLTSPDSIRSALGGLEFDRLILPAAMTAVDPCETTPGTAFAINATAPKLIAEICAEKGAHMTHVSTDFVFDGGKAGAYDEDDPAEPISVYGASKLKGEVNVLEADPDHLVVRVSWLYGPGKPAFPEWIVDKACAETEISLPGDKTGSPTSSVDVADWMVQLILDPSRPPAGGIYHLCNSGSCTWRDWGQACIDLAREAGAPVLTESIAANSLADIPAFLAPRPANSVMSNAKLAAFTGNQPRPWLQALKAHFAESGCLDKYRAAACG
jgi:dTDP-4-dehydrorhamnose reductase